MRVAFFSRFPNDLNNPRGGVETVTIALAEALNRTGEVDLHVVTLEKQRTTLQIDHLAHVTIHRLPASYMPQMVDIVMGPGKKKIRDYLKMLKPDVVHFHESYGLGIGQLPMPHVLT